MAPPAMNSHNQPGHHARQPSISFTGLACLIFVLCVTMLGNNKSNSAVNLHSEISSEDYNQESYYSADFQDEEASNWLSQEWRQLKRGSSSSSSRSSSSRSRSYGNCYGDRCDDTGGDANVAVIIGAIVGGCCFILIVYMIFKYCQKKIKKDRKKARKKNKNKIGPDGKKIETDSDSDMPREPKVIYNNDSYQTDISGINNSRMEMTNQQANPNGAMPATYSMKAQQYGQPGAGQFYGQGPAGSAMAATPVMGYGQQPGIHQQSYVMGAEKNGMPPNQTAPYPGGAYYNQPQQPTNQLIPVHAALQAPMKPQSYGTHSGSSSRQPGSSSKLKVNNSSEEIFGR